MKSASFRAARAPLWVVAGVIAIASCATPSHPVAAPSPSVASSATASSTVDLVIAATTDVHGRLRGWDYFANRADADRGLTRAATIVDSVRTANPGRVILLDAGDLLQGNPLTYVAARLSADTLSPVVAAMNAMAYDAAAIGNHEFNYGVPLLDRAVAQARFPFLSANTRRPDGSAAYRAWTIVERAGVRVGLVGATTPGVAVWDRDNVAGRLTFGDIVPAVREAVAAARAAGAAVIVVTVHSGLDEPASYDTVSTALPSENVSARLAHEVPGIDVIVFGHSHKEVVDTTIGSTLLVQPKNWATTVALVHLSVTRDPAGVVRVVRRAGARVRAVGHAEQAAVLTVTERAHQDAIAYATRAVGSTPVAWRGDSARVVDTPLLDLVLEVERKATGADLASSAAFSLAAHLDSGAVTVAELAQLYPYDNTLRAVRITGRQLREYLEYSARYYNVFPAAGSLVNAEVPGYNFDVVAGVDYTLDVAKPVGQRVTRLVYKGRPVADADSFTMALNNYRQTGGGGYAMLRGAPVVYDRQQEIRQLLIEDVQRRVTIRPADVFTANWRIEPAAAVAAAYASTHAQADEGGSGAARTAGGAPPPGSSVVDASGSQANTRASIPFGSPAVPAGARRLRIIGTNDFHGALESRADARNVRRGGAAVVATAIKRAADECGGCASILLDGGDEFQGTPASNLALGAPVTEYFNRVGYAASALGNHEFDWGTATLRARMRGAKYAILAANVRYADGHDVPWIRDDTIVTRHGIRVGVIGVATVSTPATTRAVNTVGLRFDDPAPIVDARARSLRRRGADVVIVIAHAGAFCSRDGATDCAGEIVDLANRLTERVDAIVSGHTHSLVNTVVKGIPIVQARSSGQAIAVLDLDVVAGRSTVARQVVRDVFADSLPADAGVDSIVRRAVAKVAPLVSKPVGTVADAMRRSGNQYALGNYIADAERWAGKSDVAVMNNGGIRADLRAGLATYGTLFEVQPFANVLYRVEVSGVELRSYFERLVARNEPNVHISGATLTFDPARPAGSRLLSATLDGGRAIDSVATYSVVMSDFLVTGGDGLGLAKNALGARNLNIVDLDALIAYTKSRPQPVAAPVGARIVAKTQ